jgi:uncharacterized protein YndB with AHSA1/START domain
MLVRDQPPAPRGPARSDAGPDRQNAAVADAEGTRWMAADPHMVYALVTDVTAMGRWSPESTGGRWLGGSRSAVVGARFVGSNRDGWRRWSTVCTVTEAEPGRRFAFAVAFGPVPVSAWTYDFEPSGGGVQVTESWTDRRPSWLRSAAPVVMGISDRTAHNRAGIDATLAALAATVA